MTRTKSQLLATALISRIIKNKKHVGLKNGCLKSWNCQDLQYYKIFFCMAAADFKAILEKIAPCIKKQYTVLCNNNYHS